MPERAHFYHAGRTAYRRLRKIGKRATSYVLLARLAAINQFSTKSAIGECNAVVSLTTYGARIKTVHHVIESIAQGRLRPRRLILWLDDEEEFLRRPDGLRRLEKRGLEVLLCSNYGPHKKYFPYVTSGADLVLPLVTADDDIVYPPSWLDELVSAHRQHPDEVSGFRVRQVTVADGVLQPYDTWPWSQTNESSLSHFATGVSGVIYPRIIQEELRRRGDVFMDSCPTADDIWLHWVALQTHVGVRQVRGRAVHFPFVPGTQATGLVAQNVHGGANDTLIQSLYSTSDVEVLSGSGGLSGD